MKQCDFLMFEKVVIVDRCTRFTHLGRARDLMRRVSCDSQIAQCRTVPTLRSRGMTSF